MDIELLFGSAVILLAYASAAFAWRRWLFATLPRAVVHGLALFWVLHLFLFVMHVFVSEDRVRGVAVAAIRSVADWSLYSDGLGSAPNLLSSLQGFLAAVCALRLAIWVQRAKNSSERLLWLGLGLGLAWFALDELFSFPGRSAMAKLYLVVGSAGLLFIAWLAWRERAAHEREDLLWIFTGIGLAMTGGIVLDYFSNNFACARVNLPPLGCGNFGIMEEMAEMLGMLCALAGLALRLARPTYPGSSTSGNHPAKVRQG